MPVIEIKITPKQGGGEFTVKNVSSYSIGFGRPPAANGHVGMRGFEIRTIHVSRRKSLQDEGSAKLEDDSVKLAAATEKKAYCKGEITVARDDDANNKVQTIRWDNGHICDYACTVSGLEISENFDICVTELSVDDVTVSRTQTV